MGYDLHITRAPSWTDNMGLQIEQDEWLRLVSVDPELSLDPAYGPCAVRFGAGEEDNGWFDWYEGNVYTTDPTPALVGKMLIIARQLAGTVQGDEGEVYQQAGDWRGPR